MSVYWPAKGATSIAFIQAEVKVQERNAGQASSSEAWTWNLPTNGESDTDVGQLRSILVFITCHTLSGQPLSGRGAAVQRSGYRAIRLTISSIKFIPSRAGSEVIGNGLSRGPRGDYIFTVQITEHCVVDKYVAICTRPHSLYSGVWYGLRKINCREAPVGLQSRGKAMRN